MTNRAVLLLLLLLLASVTARSAQEWKSRVIYQLLTDRFAPTGLADNPQPPCTNLQSYCGGTWSGIRENLDYIQALGFNAIYISPVVANTPNGYHGYWAQDFYSLNSNFGTVQDLQDLIDACHSRDIWVMVDVVANHMGYPPDGGDFSAFNPFNSSSQVHWPCDITNYNDQVQVEQCRIAGLPDLHTENSSVVTALYQWIGWLVSTFHFDGIRIDTVKHIRKDFWPGYVKASGVFAIGEVFNGDPAYVGDYQHYVPSTFNYPSYYTIHDAYGQKQYLGAMEQRYKQNQQYFSDMSLLANFVDNHDVPRFLAAANDKRLLQNALAHTLFALGIPVVYYGTEQAYAGGGDPNNRESLWSNLNTSSDMYQWLQTWLQVRRQYSQTTLITSDHHHVWSDQDIYAFSRDQLLVVTTNVGSGRAVTRNILSPYPPGSTLVEATGQGITLQVGAGSWVNVTLSDGAPVLFVRQ
ncbi:hypothetical protein RI367_008052 [Sorochytrium milnesiophthora]